MWIQVVSRVYHLLLQRSSELPGQPNHFPPRWRPPKRLPCRVSTYLGNQAMLWGTSFLRLFLFGNKVIKHFFLVQFPIGNTRRKHVSHYISYLFKCIPMPREQLNQKAGNAPEFWCNQMASASKLLLPFFFNFFFPKKLLKSFDAKWKQNYGLGSLHKALLIFSANKPLANLCK